MITPQRHDAGRIGYGLGTASYPDFGEPNLAGGLSLAGPHGGEDGYTTILVTVPASFPPSTATTR